MHRKFVAILLILALAMVSEPATAEAQSSAERQVTILYTNDFHSAVDPIPAYWLPGSPRLGGAAVLAGYVNRFRQNDSTVFLFDAGDMFTGLISNLTRGEALMELMRAMKYDAFGIGNHEFDYGSDNFEKQMNRVPYPVLGANIFYKGTRNRYSRPYVILERNGVRLGVIGIIGENARRVALPSGITNLDFEDPATAIAPLVKELRGQVDLVVVIAHQGRTGPQQTDAEAHPEVQRDFDEDVKLVGNVPGIDVFVGGHAHRGIEVPYVHPKTGTIVVQTYGYGTRLGYLKLTVRDGKIVSHQGELVKTWSDSIQPDAGVAALIARYKMEIAPRAGEPVITLTKRLYRQYNAESPLGNVVADAIRDAGRAEVGFENAGGLRADLAEGVVTTGNILDALPFLNSVETYRLTGTQILEVLEHSLTLEQGVMQVSGIRVEYDLARPPGSRVVRAFIGGKRLVPTKSYTVATPDFLAEGGDGYMTFGKAEKLRSGPVLSTVMSDYMRRMGEAALRPESPFVPRRLVPVKAKK